MEISELIALLVRDLDLADEPAAFVSALDDGAPSDE